MFLHMRSCSYLDVAAESMQSFRASQQPTTAKQAVSDTHASSQQTTGAAAADGPSVGNDSDATGLVTKTPDSAAPGATQQEEGQGQQAISKQESTGWVDVEKLELGQGQQPKTTATQQHLLRLPAEAGSQVSNVWGDMATLHG
jgi:hypothetical protein